MAEARIWFFDVEFGASVFVKAPNGRTLLIDCGTRTRFSPAVYISRFEMAPGERLDQLIVSHAHGEHLLDIERVAELLRPRTLVRQTYDWPELDEPPTQLRDRLSPPRWREGLYAYAEWQKGFDATPGAVDWGEMTVETFAIPVEEAKALGARWVNNSSIVVVVTLRSFKLVVPGDLEAEGWERLLERPDFREAIRGTTVYMTSYHSHPEGCTPAIYEAMGLPVFNVSVVHRKNVMMSREYSRAERALGVEYGGRMRYEFTSWRDGSLLIRVAGEGSWRFQTQRLMPTEPAPDGVGWGRIKEPTWRDAPPSAAAPGKLAGGQTGKGGDEG